MSTMTNLTLTAIIMLLKKKKKTAIIMPLGIHTNTPFPAD